MALASPLASLRVLVAEDDADMRAYLAGCLRAFGAADVAEAADGEEALALTLALAFDLIVSDVAMPGLDGRALCRALKAQPATARIPLLLISGDPHGAAPCADGFLAKPFNASGLRLHVERLLGPAPPLSLSPRG